MARWQVLGLIGGVLVASIVAVLAIALFILPGDAFERPPSEEEAPGESPTDESADEEASEEAPGSGDGEEGSPAAPAGEDTGDIAQENGENLGEEAVPEDDAEG